MKLQGILEKVLKEPIFLGLLLVLLYLLHGYDESKMTVEAAISPSLENIALASTTSSQTASQIENNFETKPRVLSAQRKMEIEKENGDAALTVLNPALVTVCACESSYEGTWWGMPRQFTRDGSVVMNHQGTNDVGMCQINATLHGADASSLGFNIYTKAGNIAYANILFNKEGLRPWEASRHCWIKAE